MLANPAQEDMLKISKIGFDTVSHKIYATDLGVRVKARVEELRIC
jgi:hypothetical protein